MGKVCRILFCKSRSEKPIVFDHKVFEGRNFLLGLSHCRSFREWCHAHIYTLHTQMLRNSCWNIKGTHPFWRMLDFFRKLLLMVFAGQNLHQLIVGRILSISTSAQVLPVLCGQWWAVRNLRCLGRLAPWTYGGSVVVMDLICWDHVPLSYWYKWTHQVRIFKH